jgi:hypothetical protein
MTLLCHLFSDQALKGEVGAAAPIVVVLGMVAVVVVMVAFGGGRRLGFKADTLFTSVTTAKRRSFACVSNMAVSMSCGSSSSTSVFSGSSSPVV